MPTGGTPTTMDMITLTAGMATRTATPVIRTAPAATVRSAGRIVDGFGSRC